MFELSGKQVCCAFQVKSPHRSGDIGIDAGLLLQRPVDLRRIIQVVDCKLASPVKAAFAKTAVELKDASLPFNVPKIESGLAGPETCPQVKARNAAILQPPDRRHVLRILEETILTAATKAFLS